mgnify:FL=1
MTNLTDTIFPSIRSWLTADVLAWIISIPLIIFLAISWFVLTRRVKRLKTQVEAMSDEVGNIEYDLVLKAMKLSTWRVDVPSMTINVESDYREGKDLFIPQKGTPVEKIFKHIATEQVQAVRNAFLNLAAGREEETYQEYQMTNAAGKKYWAAMFATIEKRDLNGRPLTIVGATTCIDTAKQVEQELLEARNHAEESDRLKSAFLANITHEVRTPLHAIVGFSDILPLAQSDEERQNLIDLIKQNNAHLLRLFDDMMNVSKLEAGNYQTIENTDVSILEVLREIADKYTTPCKEKGLTIVVDNTNNHLLQTDHDRLKEIINQYVSNAVKFTETGEIRLGYTKKTDRISIWVRDTGIGIPADKCNDLLFERFVKVNEFVPGTGIGLSICRNLAKSLKAKVGVESVMGKGSIFWIDFFNERKE